MTSTTTLISDYLAQRDLMPSTLHIYGYVLRYWFRYLVREGIQPAQVRKSDIIAYKRHLFDKGLRPATVDLYINGIKGFYRWQAEVDERYRNITTGIRNESWTKSFRRDPISVDDIHKLLNSISGTTLIERRDLALVCLLYFNALRVIEAIRINIGDIDMAARRIAIRGKGRRDKQWVEIDDWVCNAIEDYLQAKSAAGESLHDEDPLFIAYGSCRPNEVRRLKRRYVSMLLSRRMKEAGVKTPRVSAHSLRHSAAVHMIEEGSDLYAVTLFLRHTNANTSRLYTHYAEERKLISSGPTKLLGDKYKRHLMATRTD